MTPSRSLPQTAAALADADQAVSRYAMCPLCGTAHPSLTQSALEAGGEWRCARCGQHWDAARLVAVAAYAAWVVERDDVGRRTGTEGSESAARVHHLPAETLV